MGIALPARRNSLFKILLAFALLSISTGGRAVGFERSTVAAAEPFQVGIWYPAAAAVPGTSNTPFRQALAIDAEPQGNGLPLVVLSHGDGGWMGGHADTALALAEAGYVAVAITHPGNNAEDEHAGHFAFLSPCNPALENANPRIWKMVCVDMPGFDRKAFYREMNGNIIKFFDRALPGQDFRPG